ncbi:MAG TPA: TonB family protein, partial [Bradyrhizobium sp.]|nr:TonB family protein [Bradyrhizobium sp.]
MSASNKVNSHVNTARAAGPSAPSKRRTEVVILGAGDETLIEVGPALGDQYRTYSFDTARDIADVSAAAWIGLYDATAQAAGRSAFAQLDPHYAKQPWIVLCADEDKANWRDVLSRGDACAVIARSEINTETLTTALIRAAQRLTAAPAEAPAASGLWPGKPVLWIAIAAAVTVAAGAGWWLSRSHSTVPGAGKPATHKLLITGGAPAPGTSTAPAQVAPPSVEDLLSMARIAFRDPNSQLPKADAPLQGNSALELYGAVLLQQPKNDEARDGVRRLQDVARLRVQNALAAGDADTAARLLAILQRADFNPEEMRTLLAAVAAARPKQLAAQTRGAITAGNLALAHQFLDQLAALSGERSPVPELRKELEARKLDGELATAAEQVRIAIAAGSLLEPEADNARSRVLAMRDLNRGAPQTVSAEHELLLALLRRVQLQVGRQDFDGAQRTLAAAQDFGSKAELADARGALDAALTAKHAAESASVAAATPHASAPAATPAAAVLVLSPKPTRPLQIDFPPVALAQNIQGYVVVEFMLNPNGTASGATVIDASPHVTFDSAALAAVKRATFSTKDLADPRKSQRARFKINFNLSDTAAPAQAPVVSRSTPPAASPTAMATGAPAAPPPVLSPKPMHPLEVEYPRL